MSEEVCNCTRCAWSVQAIKWVVITRNLLINGAPGRIRTCDLRIRSPLLYPAELQALFYSQYGSFNRNNATSLNEK